MCTDLAKEKMRRITLREQLRQLHEAMGELNDQNHHDVFIDREVLAAMAQAYNGVRAFLAVKEREIGL
jgi:seryl-tRNA(Sec) selenium transferase